MKKSNLKKNTLKNFSFKKQEIQKMNRKKIKGGGITEELVVI